MIFLGTLVDNFLKKVDFCGNQTLVQLGLVWPFGEKESVRWFCYISHSVEFHCKFVDVNYIFASVNSFSLGEKCQNAREMSCELLQSNGVDLKRVCSLKSGWSHCLQDSRFPYRFTVNLKQRKLTSRSNVATLPCSMIGKVLSLQQGKGLTANEIPLPERRVIVAV